MSNSNSPFHREPFRHASTGVAYARNFPVGMSVGTADNALRKSRTAGRTRGQSCHKGRSAQFTKQRDLGARA